MDYKKFRRGVYRIDYPGEMPDLAGLRRGLSAVQGASGVCGPEARCGVAARGSAAGGRVPEGERQATVLRRVWRDPLRAGGEQGALVRGLHGLLREHGIGRAAWCYKDGAFGFVDGKSSQPLNEKVIRIASRK